MPGAGTATHKNFTHPARRNRIYYTPEKFSVSRWHGQCATFRRIGLAATIEVLHRCYAKSDKIVLTLDNISKSFGGRVIFDHVSWSVPDDARVSLVGLNGAGKSTLLRLIAEKLEPDSGRITRPQRSQIGYLEQDAPEMGGRSVLEETLAGLADMRALDRRRRELEKILEREH